MQNVKLKMKKGEKQCSHSYSIDMVQNVNGQYVLGERVVETMHYHYAKLDMFYLK